MNPKRTLQQLRGSIGAATFELFVRRDLEWIYRPVHQEDDFGIDAYIDIVEEGKLTGASLAVQIKCGESYSSKKTAGGIRYDGHIKHLNYYHNLRNPVLLVVLDSDGSNGKWVMFSMEKTMPSESPSKWWMEIPEYNRLTSSVASIWKEIAGPTPDMSDALRADWTLHRVNEMCTHLMVGLRKEDVIDCDTESLFRWQAQLMKAREMMLKKRGSIEFWFEGWEDDPRELHEIPEIRAFYQKSIEQGFPWIYWLQPDFIWQVYMLLYSCGCNITAKKVDDQFLVEPVGRKEMVAWIETNFHALNLFTEANGIPIEINKECSDNFGRFVRRLIPVEDHEI